MPIGPSGGGSGGSGTVTSVSSADTSIVVTNATTTPSLQLATLDVLAANEPPVGSVAMNGHKLTGLANGTAATDAAAFGQIPAQPLTGLVNADGTIAGGTGFTVNHSSTGTYAVTFTTAFAAAPTVLVTITEGPGSASVGTPGLTNLVAGSVTVNTVDRTGAAANMPFAFIAYATH